MMQKRRVLTSWIVVLPLTLVLGSCGNGTQEPTHDGYTLRGTVVDEAIGNPMQDVQVLAGWETSTQLNPHSVTDAEGRFEYHGFPGTAPSREVLRFEKPGYEPKQVAARTATREAPFTYRLRVRLSEKPTP